MKRRPRKTSSPLVNSSLGLNSYHYSFQRASRFKKIGRCDPESAYNIPNSFSNRTTSFGYGKRWTPKNPAGQHAPDPAAYSLRSCFDSVSKTSSFTGKPQDSAITLIPGPGAYDPACAVGKEGLKYSFRKRMHIVHRAVTPSPGDYDPRYNHRSLSFSMSGIDQRNGSDRPGTPGPGAYNIPSVFGGVK